MYAKTSDEAGGNLTMPVKERNLEYRVFGIKPRISP